MKCVVAKPILFLWLGCWVVSSLAGAQLDWMTDAKQALTKAKSEQKLVLLNFTGSDWCPWCIRLDKEVFSTPEFAAYANTNLVLVLVDFPRKKQLAKEQQQANRALAAKYGIKGYPTLVILDSAGNRLGDLGYKPGGPSWFIAELEKLRQKAASRTQSKPAPDAGTNAQKPDSR